MTEKQAAGKPKKGEVEEGAPKTETPETKDEVVLEDAPRDEEPELETPEEPSSPPEEDVLKGSKPPKPVAASTATSDIVELYKHVADNPVDSHAPVWVKRPANSP